MAAAGESLRTGGSSSSGVRAPAMDRTADNAPPGGDDSGAEWLPVNPRHQIPRKTPDPALTKRLRSTIPSANEENDAQMETAGRTGQKRRSEQEDAQSDGDGQAETYSRTDDFVAKASMDELAKS